MGRLLVAPPDQTYTQEQLDSAIKHAVHANEYQGSIERRLQNLENMVKEANNLKHDIIDLIHNVEFAQRDRTQMLLETINLHANKPGHNLGVARLDELEDNLSRFGFEGVGDEDASMLPSVLSQAAEGEKRLKNVERKSNLVAMNSNRIIAITAIAAMIIGTIGLIHQLWH